jgi:DNA-binding NarL/FixJ family response regulator
MLTQLPTKGKSGYFFNLVAPLILQCYLINHQTLQKNTPLILIVDDSIILSGRMIQLIREEGLMHTIAHVGTYELALEQLQLQQPDLILLDISLPDGNGIDLLRMIRSLYPDTKSIIFTNHATEYYRDLCISLGAFSFLDKSKDFELIPVYISNLLPLKAA